MAVVTHELRSDRNLLDQTELVRPSGPQESTNQTELVRPSGFREPANQLVSGNESLTLEGTCLIYRNIIFGKRTVKIVPLRNVDLFCVQTRRLRWLFSTGILMLCSAVVIGLLIHFFPPATEWFTWSLVAPNKVGPMETYWEPSLLVAVGVMALFICAIYRRVELAIWTKSGGNHITMFLSSKVRNSIERFVAEIESQMYKA